MMIGRPVHDIAEFAKCAKNFAGHIAVFPNLQQLFVIELALFLEDGQRYVDFTDIVQIAGNFNLPALQLRLIHPGGKGARNLSNLQAMAGGKATVGIDNVGD